MRLDEGENLNELALFAGAGGGILGGRLLGWRTVCAVELDPYCRDVLMARQNDKHLAPFPIWDDVRTFDGRRWRGRVDVVSGGFPCQDISSAGKGAGIDGEKSGLWSEFARIIGEVGPKIVFVENSPMLTTRGLGRVLGDLAQMGFNAEWGVLGAHHTGAPHKRDRLWIVARHGDGDGEPDDAIHAEMARVPELVSDADRVALRIESGWFGGAKRYSETQLRLNGSEWDVADTHGAQRERRQLPGGARAQHAAASGGGWWEIEPDVGRVADAVACRMDRLRAIGNGQVPAVAAFAFAILARRLG